MSEPTVSERLRAVDVMDDPLSASIIMPEAANLIDALVEALKLSFSAVNAAYQQSLAEALGHDRIADRHDKIVVAFKAEATTALARAKGERHE